MRQSQAAIQGGFAGLIESSVIPIKEDQQKINDLKIAQAKDNQ